MYSLTRGPLGLNRPRSHSKIDFHLFWYTWYRGGSFILIPRKYLPVLKPCYIDRTRWDQSSKSNHALRNYEVKTAQKLHFDLWHVTQTRGIKWPVTQNLRQLYMLVRCFKRFVGSCSIRNDWIEKTNHLCGSAEVKFVLWRSTRV